MKSRLLAVFCLVTALVATGCSSYRIAMTPEARTGASGASSTAKFKIASVQLVTPTNVVTTGMPAFGVYAMTDQELQSKLMDAGVKYYPNIFEDRANAIPLDVVVTRTGSESSIGGDACVSCLTLTILLPLRSKDRNNFSVEVKTADAGLTKSLAGGSSFTRQETGWMSIIPTGWIPVPGSGTFAWGSSGGLKLCEEYTLSATVDAVVKALKRVDQAAWDKAAAKQ